MCENICKSKGSLTKHKNSKDNASSTEGKNTPLDKDLINSIVNTINLCLIEEKLYGEEIESSIQNVTATEALLKEIEPLYFRLSKTRIKTNCFKLSIPLSNHSSEFGRLLYYQPCNDTYSRPLSIIP